MPKFNKFPILNSDLTQSMQIQEITDILDIPSVSRFAPMLNTLTKTSDVTLVAGTPTITEDVQFGKPCLKIVANATYTIACTKGTGQYFDGELALLLSASKATGTTSVVVRAFEDVATNKQFFKSYAFAADTFNHYREQGGVLSMNFSRGSLGSNGTPSNSFSVQEFRIQVTPEAGQTSVVYLFGFSTNVIKRKSRICLVFDDGYENFLTNGFNICQRHQVKSTLAVVPSAIDQKLTGYASKEQLESYINAGGVIVPHYGGNLTTDFTVDGAKQVIQDTIQWIRDNNLATRNFDKTYVWPMARYQNIVGDTKYIDMLSNLGISVCRGANKISVTTQGSVDSMSKWNRLALPTIGHNFAGTTATEATNITSIVNEINACATSGNMDVFMVLHKVVPNSTPDNDMTLSIRESDLITICNAIKTQQDAGLLESVSLTDFVSENNPWASF